MTHPARISVHSLLLLASATLIGCDDGTSPLRGGGLALSVAVAQNATGGVDDFASGRVYADIVQDDGEHTLVMSRIAMVVRDVELERVSTPDCTDDDGSSDDDCEEFETGPFLVELPVDGSVETILEIEVPADTYDELEFDIHKPDDDTADDLAFLQTHPDFKGVSIRVEGTFDGQAFVFLQDLGAEQEMDLVPPLVVPGDQGTQNLTLTVDVRSWFLRRDGTLVDPRDANKGGPDEELVETNIESSLDLFDDDDRDGEEDDD